MFDLGLFKSGEPGDTGEVGSLSFKLPLTLSILHKKGLCYSHTCFKYSEK